MPDAAIATLGKLLAYCESQHWAGYDPYDALNSKVLTALPFLNSRVPRIALTQLLKRAPFNIRPLVLIRKTRNAKALALFVSSFVRLSRIGLGGSADRIQQMIEELRALASRDVPYWCWGYSFPWQTRTRVVPAGAPNLVCTCFVANALLDAYEESGASNCLVMAVSAAEYVLNELYWTEGGAAGFSYPMPGSRVQTHNANFLGAALLCRVFRVTGDTRFVGPALAVARCSASRQEADGSWSYGEEPTQRWIDNFHTGYNLCALRAIGRDALTREFNPALRRGLAFYRGQFFCEDGAPRYFHDRTYPIDIHCVAQSIITLVELKDLDRDALHDAHAVLRWAMRHMWDARGFFYYQVLRLYTIRTSYMRWSQAWMVLALSTLLEQSMAAAPRARGQALGESSSPEPRAPTPDTRMSA
jgi:hypothetical protein